MPSLLWWWAAILRVRRDESRLIELEQSGAANLARRGSLRAWIVQLRKRLYPQATATLKQALKRLGDEPDEARALIQNALGFAWLPRRITRVPASTTSWLSKPNRITRLP